ncbi:hypothetical protein GCM10028862_15430 [Luteimonas pelagia]
MNAPLESPRTVPAWFWMVAAVALLWNLFGVAMFAMQMSMGPDDLSALEEGQRAMFESTPGWVWAAYGVAVVAGTLASIALLLRRRFAVTLFWISLVAVVVQFAWMAFLSGATQAMGVAALGLPVFVVVVAALLAWFSGRAAARGWLR